MLSSPIVIIVNMISNARKGHKANVYIKLNELADINVSKSISSILQILRLSH